MKNTQLILDSFRRIVRALRMNTHELQSKLGIGSAQLFVLQKVKPGEELSVNEIAERTLTDQSTVSVVISKLVEKKLLKKKTSPTDKRRSLLSLTPAGAKVANQSHSLVQDSLVDAIEKLTEKEREAFSKTILKIVHHSEFKSLPPSLFFEDGKKRK